MSIVALRCATRKALFGSKKLQCISSNRIGSFFGTKPNKPDETKSASTQNSGESSQEKCEEQKESDELSKALIEKFKSDIEKLKTEGNKWKDKYLVALAESENIRKRNEQQMENTKLYAISSFAKDLLNLAETLDKAKVAVTSNNVLEQKKNDTDFKSLFDGMVLTEQQLYQIFNRNGIAKFTPSVGDKFDPDHHDVMFQMDKKSESDVSGTIAQVLKPGFSIHDRNLQPAVVGVFK